MAGSERLDLRTSLRLLMLTSVVKAASLPAAECDADVRPVAHNKPPRIEKQGQ